jgi:threonine dehydratase
MRFLLYRLKLLVEPSGAAAAAAVLFHKIPQNVNNVGVVLSGGNVDAEVLSRVIADDR